MLNERMMHCFGIRLPMIAPVVAMPGQVLHHVFGGSEAQVVTVIDAVTHEGRSRAWTVRAGWPRDGDDVALLEEAGVLVRLTTMDELRQYAPRLHAIARQAPDQLASVLHDATPATSKQVTA